MKAAEPFAPAAVYLYSMKISFNVRRRESGGPGLAMTTKARRSGDRRLTCERLEPRALLAWKVFAADAETLTIGDPDDGDIGVLSYDPETNHFLLNGVDTGVAVTSSNGSPAVRANAGAASGTTFVLDVSVPFPITGGFFPEHDAPGIHVEYDGGANPNHLHVVSASVRVIPDSRQAGMLLVANSNVNIVEYQNLKGSLHLVNVGISIDARQDNGHQRWVLVESGHVSIREYFPVEATCIDPPECTQWIAPDVENLTEILDLTFAEGNLTGIYTGNGNDRITINLAGMVESSIGVKAGDGDDALLVSGSDESEGIALFPGPAGCGGFHGGGHWYDPAFPYEAWGCAAANLSWLITPGSTRIEYLEVESRTVRGLGGDDNIMGGPDGDYLDGGSGDDLLFGDDGNDVLYGGDGDDLLAGGSGNMWTPTGWFCRPFAGTAQRCEPEPFFWRRENWNGFTFEVSEDGDDQLVGGDGDDWLFGTAGKNSLNGGRGNDVLVGGDGDDRVDGGDGRNLLIAGRGRDFVTSLGNDIVVTGSTTMDASLVALRAIMAEWTSDRPLAVRVRNLTDGSGSAVRLNGDHFLSSATVSADGDIDRISARRRIDWLLASDEDLISIPEPRRRRPVGIRVVGRFVRAE
jgi:hypothetical protein